jgi:hypothetical protein
LGCQMHLKQLGLTKKVNINWVVYYEVVQRIRFWQYYTRLFSSYSVPCWLGWSLLWQFEVPFGGMRCYVWVPVPILVALWKILYCKWLWFNAL